MALNNFLLYTNNYVFFLENDGTKQTVNNFTVSYYVDFLSKEQIYYLVGITNKSYQVGLFATKKINENFISCNTNVKIKGIVYKTRQEKSIDLVFLDPV